MEEKVRLIIDGQEIEALPGQSVLEAALAADIYIPHICTHPDLPVQANCKLCVVEIEGLDAPVCSCETEVKEGMVVRTKSDDLAHRRGVAMELMLAGHPHDCTGCKMYLKCELQAMMQYLGSVHSRMRTVRREEDQCLAIWMPDLPETRDYAVYVSYKSFPNSTEDARYTIIHLGDTTEVSVNQRMGGGTWIYLGTYRFRKGSKESKVVLTNHSSSKAGSIVTADAVKFGGGMGNVARYLSAGGQTVEDARISGDPRFCEGARYWMQWAGVPDSIYNLNEGSNDYVDDYKNRGLWVNWLAGGSEVNPKEGGLHIPLDLSLAFHSDAGTTLTDQTVGTLAIFDDQHYGGTFFNGASTSMSHQLADLVQSSIVEDIRALYEPRWNRRQIWDKPYFEAWMPRVPAMLLELLSHQNFADMRYGLDPRFRFTVGRAVYKGILRFICGQRGEPCVVQPLPVRRMSLKAVDSRQAELSWAPRPDSLEPSAMPDRYLVYRRIGDCGWDNGTLVRDTILRVEFVPDKICSFKVVAVNDGGRSFDSEILSGSFAGEGFGKHSVCLT